MTYKGNQTLWCLTLTFTPSDQFVYLLHFLRTKHDGISNAAEIFTICASSTCQGFTTYVSNCPPQAFTCKSQSIKIKQTVLKI